MNIVQFYANQYLQLIRPGAQPIGICKETEAQIMFILHELERSRSDKKLSGIGICRYVVGVVESTHVEINTDVERLFNRTVKRDPWVTYVFLRFIRIFAKQLANMNCIYTMGDTGSQTNSILRIMDVSGTNPVIFNDIYHQRPL